MSYVAFVALVGAELLAAALDDEGLDLLVAVGVGEGGEVFGVGLGGEGAEGGGGAVVGSGGSDDASEGGDFDAGGASDGDHAREASNPLVGCILE